MAEQDELKPTREDLIAALRYYADGHHFVRHQDEFWDTVSGEPTNFYEDEACTATVEDGTIARLMLEGKVDAAWMAADGGPPLVITSPPNTEVQRRPSAGAQS